MCLLLSGAVPYSHFTSSSSTNSGEFFYRYLNYRVDIVLNIFYITLYTLAVPHDAITIDKIRVQAKKLRHTGFTLIKV